MDNHFLEDLFETPLAHCFICRRCLDTDPTWIFYRNCITCLKNKKLPTFDEKLLKEEERHEKENEV